MITVTLEEARDRLPELLNLVATGNRVVITDGEKWIGELTPPPKLPILPLQEDDEALLERRKEIIREWSGLRSDAPIPRPEGMGWGEYNAKYRLDAKQEAHSASDQGADHPLRETLLREQQG